MSSELHEKLSHLRDVAHRIKEAQAHSPSVETLHEWLIAVTELVLAESELARLHRDALLERIASLEQTVQDLRSSSSVEPSADPSGSITPQSSPEAGASATSDSKHS